jgi:hypothetical protein
VTHMDITDFQLDVLTTNNTSEQKWLNTIFAKTKFENGGGETKEGIQGYPHRTTKKGRISGGTSLRVKKNRRTIALKYHDGQTNEDVAQAALNAEARDTAARQAQLSAVAAFDEGKVKYNEEVKYNDSEKTWTKSKRRKDLIAAKQAATTEANRAEVVFTTAIEAAIGAVAFPLFVTTKNNLKVSERNDGKWHRLKKSNTNGVVSTTSKFAVGITGRAGLNFEEAEKQTLQCFLDFVRILLVSYRQLIDPSIFAIEQLLEGRLATESTEYSVELLIEVAKSVSAERTKFVQDYKRPSLNKTSFEDLYTAAKENEKEIFKTDMTKALIELQDLNELLEDLNELDELQNNDLCVSFIEHLRWFAEITLFQLTRTLFQDPQSFPKYLREKVDTCLENCWQTHEFPTTSYLSSQSSLIGIDDRQTVLTLKAGYCWDKVQKQQENQNLASDALSYFFTALIEKSKLQKSDSEKEQNLGAQKVQLISRSVRALFPCVQLNNSSWVRGAVVPIAPMQDTKKDKMNAMPWFDFNSYRFILDHQINKPVLRDSTAQAYVAKKVFPLHLQMQTDLQAIGSKLIRSINDGGKKKEVEWRLETDNVRFYDVYCSSEPENTPWEFNPRVQKKKQFFLCCAVGHGPFGNKLRRISTILDADQKISHKSSVMPVPKMWTMNDLRDERPFATVELQSLVPDTETIRSLNGLSINQKLLNPTELDSQSNPAPPLKVTILNTNSQLASSWYLASMREPARNLWSNYKLAENIPLCNPLFVLNSRKVFVAKFVVQPGEYVTRLYRNRSKKGAKLNDSGIELSADMFLTTELQTKANCMVQWVQVGDQSFPYLKTTTRMKKADKCAVLNSLPSPGLSFPAESSNFAPKLNYASCSLLHRKEEELLASEAYEFGALRIWLRARIVDEDTTDSRNEEQLLCPDLIHRVQCKSAVSELPAAVLKTAARATTLEEANCLISWSGTHESDLRHFGAAAADQALDTKPNIYPFIYNYKSIEKGDKIKLFLPQNRDTASRPEKKLFCSSFSNLRDVAKFASKFVDGQWKLKKPLIIRTQFQILQMEDKFETSGVGTEYCLLYPYHATTAAQNFISAFHGCLVHRTSGQQWQVCLHKSESGVTEVMGYDPSEYIFQPYSPTQAGQAPATKQNLSLPLGVVICQKLENTAADARPAILTESDVSAGSFVAPVSNMQPIPGFSSADTSTELVMDDPTKLNRNTKLGDTSRLSLARSMSVVGWMHQGTAHRFRCAKANQKEDYVTRLLVATFYAESSSEEDSSDEYFPEKSSEDSSEESADSSAEELSPMYPSEEYSDTGSV